MSEREGSAPEAPAVPSEAAIGSDVAEMPQGDPATTPRVGRGTLIALVGVVMACTFFAAYAYAARSAPGIAATGGAAECSSSSAECGTAGSGSSGTECGTAGAATGASCTDCGGEQAEWDEVPTGRALVDGGVQRIAIDVTDGYFDPTVIELTAGVPAQLVFSEGRDCLAAVVFPQFGIERDLTAGGATVQLPALQAGEYPFSCGMEMVYGVLVVR